MPTVPTGIPSVGYWTARLVTTIADTAAPKLATEVNAASSVAAECIFGKAWGGPSATYEKVKNERFCTIQSYERLGKLTYSIDDFVFAADPGMARWPAGDDGLDSARRGPPHHFHEEDQ